MNRSLSFNFSVVSAFRRTNLSYDKGNDRRAIKKNRQSQVVSSSFTRNCFRGRRWTVVPTFSRLTYRVEMVL